MNRVIWALFLFSILVTGCQKKIFTSNNNLEVHQLTFDFLSGKAKIRYNDGKENLSAFANIRIEKDKLIWISITKLGFEVVRVMIGVDSVHYLNRLKKKYSVSSSYEISQKYGFELDYNIIESLLLGNLTVPYKREKTMKDEDFISFNSTYKNINIDNFIGKESKKLEKATIRDLISKTLIIVNYNDFKVIDHERIPYSISGSIIQNDMLAAREINFEVTFNKAKFSERLSFPFNAPTGYSTN